MNHQGWVFSFADDTVGKSFVLLNILNRITEIFNFLDKLQKFQKHSIYNSKTT